MESFGNERTVQQGEDWNLDVTITMSEKDIPYIVGKLKNPFFVVTVASTKYEKNERYVKSWWNSLEKMKLPTFYGSEPIFCGELADGQVLPTEAGQGTFAEYTVGDTKEHNYLYLYTKESDIVDKTIGRKPYYNFYFDYDEEQRVDNYKCNLIFNFLSKDTSEWNSQNYLYQITLVSGNLMETTINELKDYYEQRGYDFKDWPENDLVLQYRYLKTRFENAFQVDIDEDSPLGNIESPIPILRPTKLYVYNNLRKLI